MSAVAAVGFLIEPGLLFGALFGAAVVTGIPAELIYREHIERNERLTPAERERWDWWRWRFPWAMLIYWWRHARPRGPSRSSS